MGLPLFVAKVESDLPSKASAKHDVLAPTNAGVRSVRNRTRRAFPLHPDQMTLHETRWFHERERVMRENARAMRRSSRMANNPLLGDSIQVIAAPSPPPPFSEDYIAWRNQIEPVDQAMDEFLRLDAPQRARWADELQELLGSRWSSDGLRARARIMNLRNARANGYAPESRSRNTDSLGTWTAEPRPQARRARVVSPAPPATEETLTPTEALSLRHIVEAMQRDRRLQQDRRALSTSSARNGSGRSHTSRQPRGLDGLGDRQRSMSPEMWDTLLSTMTPDPEPPSLSSSFASSFPTAQSHDTSATSFSVPDSGPRPAEGFVPEPPCDSGCENSDSEDDGPPIIASGAESRRGQSGILEGPFASGRRRTNTDRAARSAASNEREINDAEGIEHGVPSDPSHNQYLRVGWVGQLSVGASDETAPQEEINRESDTAVPSSHNEDDWSGMQLIVRRLARREDIPDEWWLEAGLSRTLGDDAEMQ